jgi:quinol monooxygenase YgiN
MTKLKVVARLKIHDGKLEAFKGLANECIRIVKEKDQGTLQYDWFLNEDQTECVVLERYQDSNAVMDHMANLGETMGQLFSVGDFSAEIFGNPSEELLKAGEGLDVVVYSEL